MDKNEYQNYIKRLCAGILNLQEQVKAKTLSKAKASDEIMKLLRNQCLFINRDYLLAAHNKQATIAPDDTCVKLNLSNEDFVTEWYPIWANSFGPFNSKEYFKNDNFRVLWLLKEPYIMKESWVKGDRGKHNQAEENYDYENMDNPTLKNVINRTQRILQIVKSGTEYTKQDAMKHICILEVNHFPGLAFSGPYSDDSQVSKWTHGNKDLLELLIGVYTPSVIIFGGTLNYFGDFENYENVFERFVNNKLEIFGDTIAEWAFINAVSDKEVLLQEADKKRNKSEIIKVGYNIKYLGESGRMYMQANQPSYGYKNALLDMDGNRIKEWMSNANGSTESPVE